MGTLLTRHLTPDDEQVLRSATLGNLNWAQERFTMADVVGRPEFAHYTRLNPTRGDFGFAAERDGRTVGAAWAVFLPADDRGYGFVDAQTPELSLWVHPDARRQGVGRQLLRLLQAEARERGISRVSLSVEAGNVARQLYEAEGFRDVTGREDDGVMTWSSHDG